MARARRHPPPAISDEPGLQPAVTPNTKRRKKWADVQLARDEELLKAGYVFRREEADRATAFFERYVVHSKGRWRGLPLHLEDWQRRPIRRMFGWYRPDGTRRYRKAHWEVPRKNGKSLLAAGCALFLTIGDGEPGAVVAGAATDKEQAKLVYAEACNMVKASPALGSRMEVYKTAIVVPVSGSSYMPLSKESRNKDGLNLHGIIKDELHEWTDAELLNKLETATGARTQPMSLCFTTAGEDLESIWGLEIEYLLRVADGGAVADEVLPVIYRAETSDDWRNPETWRLANPNYGVSVNPETLAAAYREACEKAQLVPVFKRYHLNLMTSMSVGAFDMDRFDACTMKVPAKKLKGESCWVGIDLSSRQDITASVKVFERGDGYVLLPRFYMPEEGILEREKLDRVPYTTWASAGFITLTPGPVIDYDYMQRDLEADALQFRILEVLYDPYNASQVVANLDKAGFTCVEIQQTMANLNQPTKELMNVVKKKQLVHNGNPVLRWMFSSCRAIVDSKENVMLSKKHSKRRIDGPAATVTALARAMLDESGPSQYETEKLTTF